VDILPAKCWRREEERRTDGEEFVKREWGNKKKERKKKRRKKVSLVGGDDGGVGGMVAVSDSKRIMGEWTTRGLANSSSTSLSGPTDFWLL